MTMSSVSVPVTADDIVEEDETFNVILSLNSGKTGIRAGGRDNVEVTIIDSNGKIC